MDIKENTPEEVKRHAKFLAKGITKSLLNDKAFDHSPKWHEYGILTHIRKVHENALKIYDTVDIVVPALWHDIGKISTRFKKKSGGYQYSGHEKRSAEYMMEHGNFSTEELFLVRNHAFIISRIESRDVVNAVIKRCNGSKGLIKKLVFLHAVDASGKGFIQAQEIQRSKLIPIFERLAIFSVMNLGTLDLLREITSKW